MSEIVTDKISNLAGFERFPCSSWCRMDNPDSILGSGNISSIVNTGVGTVNYNFAQPLLNPTYSAVGAAHQGGGAYNVLVGNSVQSITAVNSALTDTAQAPFDGSVSIIVFGGID